MAKSRMPPPRRYLRTEIVERVNRERARRIPPGEKESLSVKDMAARIGLTPDDWYKRTGKRGTPFTIEEVARVADILGAPRLWPFAEWEELERIFGPGPT